MINRSFYLLLFFALPSLAFSEGSGLNVNLNQLDLRLEFNDNVMKDRITGMEYIREPSGLLFDLISLIQSNKNIVSNVDQEIYIDADNVNKSLSIYLRKNPKGYIVDENKITHIDKKILINGICKALTISNCEIPTKDSQTYFYRSNLNLSKRRTDLIEFGCFPCTNDRIYTLTERFTSKQPNVQKPTFTKVTVNRQTIYHYFNKIVP